MKKLTVKYTTNDMTLDTKEELKKLHHELVFIGMMQEARFILIALNIQKHIIKRYIDKATSCRINPALYIVSYYFLPLFNNTLYCIDHEMIKD
jgi:hypothetical protein